MSRIPKDKDGNVIIPPPIKPLPEVRIINGQPVAMIMQTRSYELITPMFGGGAQPALADADMVVRPSGIRGQLRFWWRACKGGDFDGDLKAMKDAEDLLFGAASTEKKPRPSQVEIVVNITSAGEPIQPFILEHRKEGAPRVKSRDDVIPSYAAFPLQPQQEDVRRYRMNTTINSVRAKVKFDLIITFPEYQKEAVEAALWAWETFGGIGGRTRRGFGALMLTAIDGKPVPLPKAQETELFIKKGLATHVSNGKWPSNVPHLSREPKMALTGMKSNPTESWKDLIFSLKNFRQQRHGGTERGRPGRSKWPEPDEIRRQTGCRSPQHREDLSNVSKFPRGALGLPIVFHFKDERDGDPPTSTLQGSTKNYERFASPLILKPIACEGGQGVGVALVLEGSQVSKIPGGLLLKVSDGREFPVDANLTKEEAEQIPPLRGNPNVLEAFLDFIQNTGNRR